MQTFPNYFYQDFATLFTASLWDPKEWAQLIADSGAKYTVLTSKHHEGFCNWPSRWSWNWNSNDIGPKRDLVGELASAVRSKNVTFGLYYSLYEWFHPLYLADKATGVPPTQSHYVDNKMIPELVDIVNRYHPAVLWTDGDWEHDSPYWKSQQFLAWLYNESPSKEFVVTNDRWGHECRGNKGGYWTPADGYNPGRVIDHKWENCQTIGTSWGYNRKEHLAQMKRLDQLLEELIIVVAYGGNYLLNLSPTSDGLIPIIQEERLRDIGKWLRVNGDAIYKTRPWRVQHEPPRYQDHNIWYTSKESVVYAISFLWPADGKLHLASPKSNGSVTATFLLTGKSVQVSLKDGEIILELPLFLPPLATITPWVFKLENVQ